MSLKRKRTHPILDLVEALSSSLESIPSDSEKEEVVRSLEKVIQYLMDFRKRVEYLPDLKERDKVVSALETVKNFIEHAKQNPVLASALGLSYESRPTVTGIRARDTQMETGNRLFNELKDLPTESIQERLLDFKAVTMVELRALAYFLGIGEADRLNRQELIDKIVKIGFANVRGYDMLRVGSSRGGGVQNLKTSQIEIDVTKLPFIKDLRTVKDRCLALLDYVDAAYPQNPKLTTDQIRDIFAERFGLTTIAMETISMTLKEVTGMYVAREKVAVNKSEKYLYWILPNGKEYVRKVLEDLHLARVGEKSDVH